MRAGRGDLGARLGGGRGVVAGRRLALGALLVGGVVARGAVQDAVLARGREDHELVRVVAADRAGVRLDRMGVEAAALEDAEVRVVHLPVGDVRVLRREVEGVGVLHDELLATHEAEARADLVAELRLDLVDRGGELAVGRDERAEVVGRDLLVRGPEDHRVVVAVPEAEHALAHDAGAAGLLPERDGLQRREKDFARARAIHFLADDLLDLVQHADAEGRIGVEAALELDEEAGAHHQLVGDDLRVLGVFAEGGEEGLGPAHGGMGEGMWEKRRD